MKWNVLLFCLLYSLSGAASEQLVATGEAFDKSGKTKYFSYERYTQVEGNKVTSRAVYKDLKGQVATEEIMVEVDGQLQRYEMNQKQLDQKAWIEVADKKITFNLKKPKKRNYPKTEKWKDNFVMGLQIVPTIVKHWADFISGKEREIKLGVWHRQETITFDLKKDSGDDKMMVVKMSPSSFLIRQLVDPIYFHFDKKTKALVKYVGRTTPKQKKGEDFADFDGLVTFKAVQPLKNKKTRAFLLSVTQILSQRAERVLRY